MYVLRDAAKNTSAKDKSTFSLVPKRDDQLLSDKSVNLAAGGGAEELKEESGVSGAVDAGKKKVLLLKGKEREISHHLQQQNVTSPVKNILGANAPKQNQRREGSGRIIRSILREGETTSSPSTAVHTACNAKEGEGRRGCLIQGEEVTKGFEFWF